VKLVDTPASGAGDLTVVEVRVFSWAPIQKTEPLARFFIACDLIHHEATIRRAPEAPTLNRFKRETAPG
jgi:hypothetical protein